ncbi:SLC5 family protein [Agaribacter marinus]|uniref:Solute:sodium symporter family transporter n=1 Tax=Agaribacter marinus TaxID=1431249 RepID=A0AA37WJ02_9ALTE|nr:SLC5 family protein [Agaribacter marinus]GLR71717.1 solute:sodium symporter family transporter [Agaribacter marinus]
MSSQTIQVAVFLFVTALIGLATYMHCRGRSDRQSNQNKEYFLAGGGLAWYFVAGSITLTNLSTDQLVGMNGNQMALLALWEFAAVIGLIILAKVFLPVYYRYNCTTTTELLEKRYHNRHIRAIISLLFFFGSALIFCPAVIYSGALFMQNMFNVDAPLMYIAIAFAVVGAVYAIFGGLRAVAVSDTYSGVLLLFMAVLVVILALKAIDFSFDGVPAERLTLIGDNDSPIPWHTLFTGMIFIQMFYWGTNQVITQRAMAAPNIKEAQKGVFAAAAIRFMIVPSIIVIPGIVAFKLYGDIGDSAYGTLVADLLPSWLSGIFAAAMAAAVLTTFNSNLNSATALYVCDIHEAYINDKPNVPALSGIVTILITVISLLLVQVYAQADSIINLIQQLYGLLSMPILSVFILGLVFKNVHATAGIFSVVYGVVFYSFLSFKGYGLFDVETGMIASLLELHFIHQMFITLASSIALALLLNWILYKEPPQFTLDQLKGDVPAENVG